MNRENISATSPNRPTAQPPNRSTFAPVDSTRRMHVPVKPEVQSILDLLNAAEIPLDEQTPAQLRAGFAQMAVAEGEPVGAIVDHEVDGPHGIPQRPVIGPPRTEATIAEQLAAAPFPYPDGCGPWQQADVRTARDRLGWRPRINLEESLADIWMEAACRI